MNRGRILLLSGAFVTLLVMADRQPALAKIRTSADVTRVTVKSSPPDTSGKQQLQVTITIDRDRWIYANRVGGQDLAEHATTIQVTSNGTPVQCQAQFPKGTKIEYKDLQICFHVYKDTVTIPVTVSRKAGDTAPLEVTVTLRADRTGGP